MNIINSGLRDLDRYGLDETSARGLQNLLAAAQYARARLIIDESGTLEARNRMLLAAAPNGLELAAPADRPTRGTVLLKPLHYEYVYTYLQTHKDRHASVLGEQDRVRQEALLRADELALLADQKDNRKIRVRLQEMRNKFLTLAGATDQQPRVPDNQRAIAPNTVKGALAPPVMPENRQLTPATPSLEQIATSDPSSKDYRPHPDYARADEVIGKGASYTLAKFGDRLRAYEAKKNSST
jgi:hypothetical protein